MTLQSLITLLSSIPPSLPIDAEPTVGILATHTLEQYYTASKVSIYDHVLALGGPIIWMVLVGMMVKSNVTVYPPVLAFLYAFIGISSTWPLPIEETK